MLPEKIDFELVERYLDHRTTPYEERLILEWLEESDENKRYFSDLITHVSLHSTLRNPVIDKKEKEMLDRLDLRIDAESIRSASLWKRVAGISSALAFAVACVAIFFIIRPSFASLAHEIVEDQYQYAYANTTPSTATLTLGDGTKVFLRPGSELQYNVTSLDDRRIVGLQGEAFFDVAYDTLRPFMVKTSNIAIKVLGTAFSVHSSTSFQNTEVVLARGSVRIFSSLGTPLVTLSPDQKAVFNSTNNCLSVESVMSAPYIAEHFNLITLDDVTIPQIIASIEKTFGVKVSSKGVIDQSEKFFFSYQITDSVSDVLSLLEFISGHQFE